jgi:AcrR family transcriptional regulator
LTGTAAPGRRDARRNRDSLVQAAQEAFAAGETPSLEAVARSAQVGIGTLYRHFPTRESLVEAVYRSELEAVCSAAERLVQDLPADRALREWMDRYVAFVRAKRGMADALRAILALGAGNDTRTRIRDAVGRLLSAGGAAGLLRTDVPADDVVVGMIGACLATTSEDQAQTARLLDLLLEGLRAR